MTNDKGEKSCASAVPFTQEDVRKYLDTCIVFWRKKCDSGGEGAEMAGYYVDAYQSVRESLFGGVLVGPGSGLAVRESHGNHTGILGESRGI